ncbi:KPN_02809 family neutral zinc metallopeptidase [Entomomonas asaccharolytica]|uniref:Neutral zinc metallopeptidase n=1 Tax=Entomomonas asaccharolytica TaxID=2785331 RepID=A0A974NDB5_9GAMM|nr:neutral zinc metallopeptidase [Entomomonas asaccharolytica]QQP84413.1 neutral zinc metallopeptidase [Entomomonas asaccharolytica]
MRWKNRRESDNIEDRRSDQSMPMGGFSLPRGKLGIAVIVIVFVASYYGIDLTPLLTGQSSPVATQQQPVDTTRDNEMAQFTSVVLATTEDTWTNIFQQMGKQYTDPKLVLYRGATRTGCGVGQSVMGPFYCPTDSTVYIDLSFYEEMKTRFGAGGDFAQGYVIAHEVGHHVQHLLGITDKMRAMQQGRSEVEQNKLSVKLELQADCLAGVWGHYMENENILDPNDLQEALNAAMAIGDDRLQKQAQGRVIPDSFTHGTSEQRYTWFKTGFDSGKVSSCNTFN